MPIYEYTCPQCGARFSKLQPMSAPREGQTCPSCGAAKARRVMSTFATSGCESPAANCGPSGSRFT